MKQAEERSKNHWLTHMESSRKEVKLICRLTKQDDSSEYAYLVGSNIRGPTRPCTDDGAAQWQWQP